MRARVTGLLGALVVATALVLVAGAGSAFAGELLSRLPEPTWQANATVRDIVPSADGKTAFIGGDFDYVGPHTGFSARLAADGTRNGTWPRFTGGDVREIAPVVGGGWIVMGTFTHVDGLQFPHIVRLSAFGTLDTGWKPTTTGTGAGFSGGVPWALQVTATSVYVGGDFGLFNGSTTGAERLVRIDLASGVFDSGYTNAAGFNGAVTSLAHDGTWLYAGGSFTSYGGGHDPYLTRLDATGEPDGAWSDGTVNDVVSALDVENGRLYAGGFFSAAGAADTTRQKVAAWSITDGVLDPTFAPDVSSAVYRLTATPGGVFIAGDFTSPAYGITMIHAETGAASGWSPQSTAWPLGERVQAFHVAGGYVYVGGSFLTLGGVPRLRLARFDAATLALDPAWKPNVGGGVLTISSGPSGSIMLGGRFHSVGGVPRRHLAQLDLETGEATGWSPTSADFPVYAIAQSGPTVYAAGGKPGKPARIIAAPTGVDGTLVFTEPLFDITSSAAPVADLEVVNSKLVLGGSFTHTETLRSGIVGLELDGSTDLNFSPPPSLPDVRDIEFEPTSNVIYVAGSFPGQLTRLMAGGEVDAGWGTPSIAGGTATVARVSATSTGVWFIGDFTTVSGVDRFGQAALASTTNGAVEPPLAWNPSNTPTTNAFEALDHHGSDLLVGGPFTMLAGQSRSRLGAVDPIDISLARDWAPLLPVPFGTSIDTIASSGTRVIVGGGTRGALAIFDVSYDTLAPFAQVDVAEPLPNDPSDSTHVPAPGTPNVYVRTNGSTAPRFTARTIAYDQYPVGNPSYSASTGLHYVGYAWTSTGDGTWSPGDHAVSGARRGLTTDCWKTYAPDTDPARYLGRRTDRNIGYYFGINDPDKLGALPANLAQDAGYAYPNGEEEDETSYRRLSCRWSGWIIGPIDGASTDGASTYRVRTNGDNDMLANIDGVATIDGWGFVGTSEPQDVTFTASQARQLTVDWGEQTGDAQAALEWNPNPDPDTAFVAVPPAAFVTNAQYVQEFQLLDGAGATDGPKSLEIRAVDRVGHTEIRPVTVNIDNTAPSASTAFQVLPSFGWSSTGSYTVDLPDVAETGAGIHSLDLQRRWYDGLSGGACSGTFYDWTSLGGGDVVSGTTTDYLESGLGTGCYQYRYVMTDNVGNVATVYPTGQGTADWHKVDLSEAVGGDMTYTATVTNATSFSVEWTPPSDPESGIAQTQLYRDVATLQDGMCQSDWTVNEAVGALDPANPFVDTSISSGHCYRYSLNIVNGAGAARHAPVGQIVEVDHDDPAAAVDAAGVLQDTVVVSITTLADAASGVASVHVSYSGSSSGTICSVTVAPFPSSCDWDTTTVLDGSYVLSITATDRAGNTTTTTRAAGNVIVDNGSPIVGTPEFTPVLNPAAQYVEPAASPPRLWVRGGAIGSVEVGITATDDGTGVVGVDFPSFGSWIGSTDSTGSGTPPRYEHVYSFDASSTSGSGTIYARDDAAHATPAPVAIEVDPGAPTGMSLALQSSTGSTAELTSFVSGADGGSGVATHELVRRGIALDPGGSCDIAALDSQAWDAGALASWGSIVTSSTFSDATVRASRCYRYGLRATDNVGNVATGLSGVFQTLPSGLTVTRTSPADQKLVEGDSTPLEYALELDTVPTDTVTVRIEGDGQVSASPVDITFVAGDRGPYAFTVLAPDDDLDEFPAGAPESSTLDATVVLAIASSADPDYTSALDETMSLQFEDDDVPGLAVSAAATGVTIAEPSTADSFTVRLETQPHGPVTVTLGSGAQATAAFVGAPAGSPTQLTIDPADWQTPRTVTVTPVDDPDIEGSHSSAVTVTTSHGHASDIGYASLAKTVAVTITDDDLAGLEMDGPIDPELSEADPTVVATVRARLRARPVSDVTLSWITSGGQLVASGPLTFTFQNWNEWQVATIRAADDTVAEPPLHQVIGGAELSSADPNFAAVAPVTGPVTIRDDDPAAFVTLPGSGWTTNDDGQLLLDESATSGSVLRIRTMGDPTSDITITPVALPAEQLVISPASQTIPAGSHEQFVRFSVRAVDDRVKELDPHPATVTWKVTTSDVMYGGASIPVTVARIKDGVATTTGEITPDPTPDPTPTPTADPAPTTIADGGNQDDGTSAPPQATGDGADHGDDPPATTVGDGGSGAEDSGAGTGSSDEDRSSRAAVKAKNPAKRIKDWASDNKGKASVAASAAGTAALWGAKPLALAGKALMSGGGGLPGHPPGMTQVRHLFKRKLREKVRRFLHGRKRDDDDDDDHDWDDFLWGDRAA